MARKNQSLLNDSSDHDILITLVASVQSNHATMLDKVASLQADMVDVKTNSNQLLNDHEQRLRAMEKLRDEMNPQAQLRRFEDVIARVGALEQDSRDGAHDRKVFLWIVSALGGMIAFLISQFVNFVASNVHLKL